jgi:hypothetical protein
MARDYYQRGKIESATIGLLAKTCLLIAGNAWNRMQVQLMNKENERKVLTNLESVGRGNLPTI